ncbi:MAG: AEC family transporter [Corynebacterium sp.]|nr:AEC family transporter [Corynebacterium sp.]
MQQVLLGFSVIVMVIALGWALARTRVLGEQGAPVLVSFVYYVALPALLLRTLLTYELSVLFSARFVIIIVSAWIIAGIMYVVHRRLWRHQADTAVIGLLAASYANSSNLGIPLAAYVIGDASLVVPLLIFQVAIYTPLAMVLLDLLHSPHGIRWRTIIQTPLRNPLFIAAIFGGVLAQLPADIPQVLYDVIDMLADSSIPLALIVFGMSLYGAGVLRSGEYPAKQVWVTVLAKNIGHPLLAGLLAWALGLEGAALAGAVFLGALPTAQNVYTYALRHQTATTFARDTGIVSTVVSLPLLAMIAVVFGM